MRTAGIAAAMLLVVVGGALLIKHGVYGYTLFAVVPLILGILGAYAGHSDSPAKAAGYGALFGSLPALALFALGLEGLICVAMALPLTSTLGAFGGLLYYWIRPGRIAQTTSAVLLLLPLGTLGFDVTARPPVYEVRTSIEIAAPPETVWHNVVSFAEIPEPDQWLFRAGLAYPRRARIQGTGPGAVRYCEFSTGPFVEPIEVWNEPSLLRFRVTQNPPPMHEWSPYAHVLPKHLHGYFISKQGQFRLTPLDRDRTLLEGTTWYQHGLWPAPYWRLWSDAIIHRIHLRVLTHIRKLSES
jgi:hypothetical protein